MPQKRRASAVVLLGHVSEARLQALYMGAALFILRSMKGSAAGARSDGGGDAGDRIACGVAAGSTW